MNHSDVEELLPWYVNGTLDDPERAEVERELASCGSCGATVEELRTVMRGLAELHERAPEPSPTLEQRVLARIGAAPPARDGAVGRVAGWIARVPTGVRIGLGAAVAASAVTLLLLGPPDARHSVEPTPRVAMMPAPDGAAPLAARNAVGAFAAPAMKSMNADGPATIAVRPQAASRGRSQMARSGSVVLLVDSVEQALSAVRRYAQERDGEIVRLEDHVPTELASRHTASLDLRVPAARFDEAMDAVPKLGVLESRSIQAEDVGGQIVDTGARLRNLRRTEADLLQIMGRSGKVGEVLEVEEQLSTVREQIEQLDGSLASLQNRVATATISIVLEEPSRAKSAQAGDASGIRDAWARAVRSVHDVTLSLIAALFLVVVFLPYAAALAVAGLVLRRLLRRRPPA